MFLKDNYSYNSIRPIRHCQMCGKVVENSCEDPACLCENCQNLL